MGLSANKDYLCSSEIIRKSSYYFSDRRIESTQDHMEVLTYTGNTNKLKIYTKTKAMRLTALLLLQVEGLFFSRLLALNPIVCIYTLKQNNSI